MPFSSWTSISSSLLALTRRVPFLATNEIGAVFTPVTVPIRGARFARCPPTIVEPAAAQGVGRSGNACSATHETHRLPPERMNEQIAILRRKEVPSVGRRQQENNEALYGLRRAATGEHRRPSSNHLQPEVRGQAPGGKRRSCQRLGQGQRSEVGEISRSCGGVASAEVVYERPDGR